MAYATHSDVELELKGITLSSSTALKDSTVDGWCDEESAVIDSFLAGRCETPITGTQALKIVKFICIQLVRQRVREVLAVKVGDDRTDQADDAEDSYQRARNMLNQLRDGKLGLTDATEVSLSAGSGPDSYGRKEDLTHTFRKGEDQW